MDLLRSKDQLAAQQQMTSDNVANEERLLFMNKWKGFKARVNLSSNTKLKTRH